MKRIASVILALLLTFPAFFILPASAEETVVEIASAADLAALRNNLSAHAVLTSNLTLSGDWTPIGDPSAPFSGVFHGCGHTITLDLTVNTSTANLPIGVFGCLSGSISCLAVDGSIDVVSTAGAIVGPVAAIVKDGGTVTKCRSNVAVVASCANASAIGGLVGETANTSASVDGTVSRCRFTGSITVSGTTGAGTGDLGSNYTNGAVGGILGFSATSAKSVMTQCVNEGTITVNGWKYNVGGIVGQTSSNNTATTISITECANKGPITINNLTGERAAGIIAYVKGGTIDYCYNVAPIIAYSDNGQTVSRKGYGTYFGIFGYANLGSSNKLNVRYCYNASPDPLEAEICTLRNPSYGTFRNYYIEGREEYETSLNSNAKAGTAGTTFTDAADLTSKLTAAAGEKYSAVSDEQDAALWPILSFERDPAFALPYIGTTWSKDQNVLPTFTTGAPNVGLCRLCGTEEQISGTPAHLGWHSSIIEDRGANDRNALTFIGSISTDRIDEESADCLHVTISFIHKGEVVKTKVKELHGIYSTITGVASTDPSTASAQGVPCVYAGLIFAIKITNVPTALYTVRVSASALLDGETVASAEREYENVFSDIAPRDLKVGGLPDYFAEGTVSPVYNAGPGLASDQSSTTAEDCPEVILTGTTAAKIADYLASLPENGFTQVFQNSVDGTDYRVYSKDGVLYCMSTKGSELRIVKDLASSAPVTALTGGTGDVEPAVYQYALDFTKNNQQTSGEDYWAIDCGMCYIIHLADNSLFIIDGGHMRQSSDAALDALNDYLHGITNTPAGGKVHISGWFFSHPHGDHVYLTFAFLTKYHAQYDLDATFFNFPSYQVMGSNYDSGTFLLKQAFSDYYPDCAHYKLHTGQTFSLPGVGFEVIYTHEDAVQASTGMPTFSDCNNASTVLRASVGGKSVMFLGDINTSAQSVILSKYNASTLKSDAVQLAHHCINNVSNLYAAIAAPLILCPNSQENVDLNSSKINNRQGAIDGAGSAFRAVLYAGDFNYKLTFDGDDVGYETAGKIYTDALYFEKPESLDLFTGAQTAESPIDASLLSSLTNLSDLIIAKSGRGTAGTGANEAPQRIFDGNTNTKWCETTTSSPCVMFRTKTPVVVSAYALSAGNDTGSFNGRNPKSWTLWGSPDGLNWTAIDSVYNGNMNTASYSTSAYAADAAPACSYFVLTIHELVSGSTMQLSELTLYGTAA